MNPLVHTLTILSGAVAAASVPLILRKVPPNRWYGIRIPESFASEADWFDLNAYGGKALLLWAAGLAVYAGAGTAVIPAHWPWYDLAALIVVVGGLIAVTRAIRRFAKRARVTKAEGSGAAPLS